jgi:hypothetical protein
MSIVAIDPGSEKSAWISLHDAVTIIDHGITPNGEMLARVMMAASMNRYVVIESTKPYTVDGKFFSQLYDTAIWIGRFVQAYEEHSKGVAAVLIDRRDVKLHLLSRASGTDARVIDALRDRFNLPAKVRAPKGHPLYGVTRDRWQALALGLTYLDRVKAF